MQPLPRDPWPTQLPPSFFAALRGPAETLGQAVDAADAATVPAGAVGDDTLSRLLRALPDGVLVLDADLRCRGANPAAQPLLRPAVRWDAVDGLSWHEALDDGWIETLLPWMAPALRGEGGRIPVERERGAKHTHWQITLVPDWHAQRVAGVFVLLRDETATQREQATLRDQQQDLRLRLQRQDAHLALQQARWHALSEGLRDAAIFFLDPSGVIQDWPASAERLLGYAAADVIGTRGPDAPDAPHPLPPDAAPALERAALLGQSESTGWLRCADGSSLWAHLVYTALTGADGEPLGTACLVRDMTEVRRLEELLRDLNQALERKVEERTRQLQAVIQDLEAFSYSVSHDLRAPLRHITAYVQLLREDLGTPLTPAVAEDLRTIEDAATHMGRLIEGLLAFARLGRADLRRQSVDMISLVHSSLHRVQHDPALQRPDGEVELDLPAALPAVEGDPLLLSQVWDNLLANAFKYSRPRHPARIAVGGGYQTGPTGDEAVFWVCDNGVGFDPARAERLFGVFQRLHRAQDFEGTGIGLALCRRIVERHGGRIWADARPGEGATFHFALPLRSDPATDPDADATAADPDADQTATAGPHAG